MSLGSKKTYINMGLLLDFSPSSFGAWKSLLLCFGSLDGPDCSSESPLVKESPFIVFAVFKWFRITESLNFPKMSGKPSAKWRGLVFFDIFPSLFRGHRVSYFMTHRAQRFLKPVELWLRGMKAKNDRFHTKSFSKTCHFKILIRLLLEVQKSVFVR